MSELIGQTKSLLADLIGFDTVSSKSNLDLIAYCTDLLKSLGAKLDYSENTERTKANLFATIGPDIDGGIVLSGHTDVVPVEGQDWSSDPFKADEREGLIYGRGACDMKGFLACCLAVVPKFSAADLDRPIHLAFTYDEEVGCLGAGVLLEALERSGRKPAICIVGEPTSMRVAEGHKGCYEYTTRFSGQEGHSSNPENGLNAIEFALRFMNDLYDLSEVLKERAPHNSPFTPHWSTVQVGTVAGGIAHNVIARECAVGWDFRPVNSEDTEFGLERMQDSLESLREEMKLSLSAANVVTETVGEVAGLEPMARSAARELVISLTGNADTGVVSFGTEGGLFQRAGVSTVICGPGSIDQAHRPDEFVSVDQLKVCLDMLEKLTHVDAP